MTKPVVRRYVRKVGNADWKDLATATSLAEFENCKSFQLDAQTYVFETQGHLTSDLLFSLFESCWKAPGFSQPYGVVNLVTGDVTYDPDVRYFTDRDNLISAAAVGVVVEKVLARMVLSTVGIATKLRHGTELTSHATFDEALSAVRKAVAKRSAAT